MARRLILIRHARAQHMNPRGDRHRELVGRGVSDATALGQWLSEQDLVADLAIVSTAVRAQQTLAAMTQAAGEVETWTDQRLYNGGISGLVTAVSEAPETVQTLWIVGHEPVMSSTTWEIADAQQMSDALHDALSSGFPPATAAVLEVSDAWDALSIDGSRLELLHTPR